MLNDERQNADKPDGSDCNDHILNNEQRKNPMLNITAQERRELDYQTKAHRDEEDSLKQEWHLGPIECRDIWQVDTIEDLKKSMRSEQRLSLPRTSVIKRSEPQRAIRLIRHHTESALARVSHFGNFMFEWGTGKLPYHQIREIIELQQDFPKYIRSRLDPVFSRPGLFDPEGRYELGFARWEREFIFDIETLDRIYPDDSTARNGENYTMEFEAPYYTLKQTIRDMRDELASKYGAALH